jgi:hypothetical protein
MGGMLFAHLAAFAAGYTPDMSPIMAENKKATMIADNERLKGHFVKYDALSDKSMPSTIPRVPPKRLRVTDSAID